MSRTRVLILCTGNSARSQMAEGLLRSFAGDRFEVFSAGTKPVGLNPNAVRAMSEVGIDIASHRSKSVDEFLGQQFDYVITVCDKAGEPARFSPAPGSEFITASKIRRSHQLNRRLKRFERCGTKSLRGLSTSSQASPSVLRRSTETGPSRV